MTHYTDLNHLTEDERIEKIGNVVMQPRTSAEKPITATFVVEDEAKADRYITKLNKQFPRVRVLRRFLGPCAGMVSVMISGPQT